MTTEHLEALRQLMKKKNVDAVIVPGTDPHHSEYVSDHWKFRDWLTGFTGTNGTAVVTAQDAGLWTDSRYFLQAEQELAGSGFELHREAIPGEATIEEWLAANLGEDAMLALDGRLFSLLDVNRYENFCAENGFMFAPDFPMADLLWQDRPARPMSKAFVHDEALAGETVDEKVERLVEKIEEQGCDSMFIAALDEIAWLYNLRGSDVACTPVAIAFAYVSDRDRVLFIDEEKLTPEVKAHLDKYKIRVREYDDVERFLTHRNSDNMILLDPNTVSDAMGQALLCGKVYAASPINALKAVKNETQIEGFRKAHERDGVALVRLMRWLEQAVPGGNVTELDVAAHAIEERSREEYYRGDSFEMIAGYKEHGAIVHYSATPDSAATLAPDGLFLIDTGGQYLDGTTDITRTITLGNPTEQERHDYTLVLKGHLALARAQFPVGTCGVQLDALARMPLWLEGLGYGHGTGHGVGHFLGCHEGPHSIRTNLNPVALRPGMVTSDEPGLYKAGEYGIRIENLLLVVEGEENEFGHFLRFENLTLFPYDSRLIDLRMLTPDEVEQINAYHRLVYERLSPALTAEEQAWLTDKCRPLSE
ncbi:MAG: aminopeptidase P family protein [Muribaculaceae bacterium]|nr:aminopeptidase P family protein [Muribaculaceae bacterium]